MNHPPQKRGVPGFCRPNRKLSYKREVLEDAGRSTWKGDTVYRATRHRRLNARWPRSRSSPGLGSNSTQGHTIHGTVHEQGSLRTGLLVSLVQAIGRDEFRGGLLALLGTRFATNGAPRNAFWGCQRGQLIGAYSSPMDGRSGILSPFLDRIHRLRRHLWPLRRASCKGRVVAEKVAVQPGC